MLSTSVLRPGSHAKKKKGKDMSSPAGAGFGEKKINKHVHQPIGVWMADCCLSAKFTCTWTGHIALLVGS
jgi:hypothetical protein